MSSIPSLLPPDHRLFAQVEANSHNQPPPPTPRNDWEDSAPGFNPIKAMLATPEGQRYAKGVNGDSRHTSADTPLPPPPPPPSLPLSKAPAPPPRTPLSSPDRNKQPSSQLALPKRTPEVASDSPSPSKQAIRAAEVVTDVASSTQQNVVAVSSLAAKKHPALQLELGKLSALEFISAPEFSAPEFSAPAFSAPPLLDLLSPIQQAVLAAGVATGVTNSTAQNALVAISDCALVVSDFASLSLQERVFSSCDTVMVLSGMEDRAKTIKQQCLESCMKMCGIRARLFSIEDSSNQAPLQAHLKALRKEIDCIEQTLSGLDKKIEQFLHDTLHTDLSERGKFFRKYSKRFNMLSFAQGAQQRLSEALRSQKFTSCFTEYVVWGQNAEALQERSWRLLDHIVGQANPNTGGVVQNVVTKVNNYLDKAKEQKLSKEFVFYPAGSMFCGMIRYVRNPSVAPFIKELKESVQQLLYMYQEAISYASKFYSSTTLQQYQEGMTTRKEALGSIEDHVQAIQKKMMNCYNKEWGEQFFRAMAYFSHINGVIRELKALLHKPIKSLPAAIEKLYAVLQQKKAIPLNSLIHFYNEPQEIVPSLGISKEKIKEAISAMGSALLTENDPLNCPLNDILFCYDTTSKHTDIVEAIAKQVIKALFFDPEDDHLLQFILHILRTTSKYADIYKDALALEGHIQKYESLPLLTVDSDKFMKIFQYLGACRKTANSLLITSYIHECSQLIDEIDPVNILSETLKTRATLLLQSLIPSPSKVKDRLTELLEKALYSNASDTRNRASNEVRTSVTIPNNSVLYYEFVLARYRNNEPLSQLEEKALIDCLTAYVDNHETKELFRVRHGVDIEIVLYDEVLRDQPRLPAKLIEHVNTVRDPYLASWHQVHQLFIQYNGTNKEKIAQAIEKVVSVHDEFVKIKKLYCSRLANFSPQ